MKRNNLFWGAIAAMSFSAYFGDATGFHVWAGVAFLLLEGKA